MKKITHTHHTKKSSSNGRNIIIAFIVLVIVLGAFFVIKSKKNLQYDRMQSSSPIVGTTFLQMGPDQGCKTDEASGNYICNIGIQNTSDEQMDWAATVTDIEGATLSSGGGGSISSHQSGVVELSVPIAFCDDPENSGTVSFVDKSKSINQGEVSFSCQ